jgi:glycosyltransferase involved in cell wall biosynthesis
VAVHACTIIARNYLPFARVLGSTFASNHPDGTLTVLVFDDVDHQVVGANEPFDVVHIEDLGEDVPELYRMAAMYDVTEFATALKPWLLEMLLRRGAPSVMYIDPDIQVFDSLEEIAGLAAANDIVLTPHAVEPLPRDGKMTSETAILASGIYNLGFIGVGQGALETGPSGKPSFFSFWKDRLVRECVNDPQGMRFVDQRWMDFVPAVYEPAIMREKVYNVAYWNLDHRDLVWNGTRYEIDGQPLKFFHFSGFSPNSRHLLSKHQIDCPRILLSERPHVRRICDEYADLLLANGFGERGAGSYAFGRMANGVPIDDYVRRVYRDAVLAADEGDDEYPPIPWTAEGAEALCRWMSAPPRIEGDPGQLSVYMATVFGIRVNELRPQFFDPQAADRERFLTWAHAEADLGNLIDRFVDVSASDTPDPEPSEDITEWAPANALRPGYLVAGYMKAELGVGEGARLMVECLDAAGLPYSTFAITRTLSRQEHTFVGGGEGTRDFDVNLLCVNADQVPVIASTLGPGFFAGRHTVGQWAWELEEFPDRWSSSFGLVDEIWAVSEFSRKAIAANTDKPVYAVPHAIVEPHVAPGVDRAELGVPDDRCVFLFCLDLLSVLERKNPLGLIEAYQQAFGPDDGAALVLKVINGDLAIADLERLRLAVGSRDDIILLDGYLPTDHVSALMALSDCYVSLHRSEGFGLTMAEAMALGKPVIATGYSGNLDFMDDTTAYLVPWAYAEVTEGCGPYPVGAKWADPDLAVAAQLMRQVFEHPDEAAAKGAAARTSVLTLHSPSRRAPFLRERLAAIEDQRAAFLMRAAAADAARGPGPIGQFAARVLRSERAMRYPKKLVRRVRAVAGDA